MFFKYTWPALTWALIILILCAIPGQDLPKVEIINFDKVVHACMFALLTFLMIRGLRKQTTFDYLHRHYKLIAMLFCVPYGGLLEIMQATVCINRNGDWYDFFADGIGCFIGFWAVRLTTMDHGR